MGTARLIGVNHVAFEVGDLDAALALYGRLFAFELRGRGPRMAFIDMGDQFLALIEGRTQPPDEARHFGLVVDDVAAVHAALAQEPTVEVLSSKPTGVDFRDPWGNLIQVVSYRDIQFERSAAVQRALGIAEIDKTPAARAELEAKGLL